MDIYFDQLKQETTFSLWRSIKTLASIVIVQVIVGVLLLIAGAIIQRYFGIIPN